jgi:hypothetical protein
MSMEAFLINPAKRRRKRVTRKVSSGKRRRRGGGLPSGLLSRMIKTYGIKRGMKEAWKAYRSGARNPKTLPRAFRTRVSHRPVTYGTGRGTWKRSPLATGSRLENPFGEEVMIVGNPRRRRARRKVRRNEPGRKRVVHHRRRYSMRHNDPGRKRVYHRRHYRRNPARSTALAISYRRPMSLIVPAIAGTGGFFVADYVPTAIGMSASPLTRIGIKAGVAFGGGMLASKFLGSKVGVAFAIGAGINMFNDVLRTYVLKTGVTAGLGAFTIPRLGGMGAMSPYSGRTRSPYAAA